MLAAPRSSPAWSLEFAGATAPPPGDSLSARAGTARRCGGYCPRSSSRPCCSRSASLSGSSVTFAAARTSSTVSACSQTDFSIMIQAKSNQKLFLPFSLFRSTRCSATGNANLVQPEPGLFHKDLSLPKDSSSFTLVN